MRVSRSLNLKQCANLTSCANILVFDAILTLKGTWISKEIMHAEVSVQFQSFETGEKEMPNWQKARKPCYMYVSKKSFQTRTDLIQHYSYLWSLPRLHCISNCLYTFMLVLLRNLQWKGKGNSFLCKRKNLTLICSIKYFLSIKSTSLGFSVELIKLVIEYVHYGCSSFTV